MHVLADGPPGVVWEELIEARDLHLLQPTGPEGVEVVMSPTEFEEDNPEGEDVSLKFDVQELANPSQEHLCGRLVA